MFQAPGFKHRVDQISRGQAPMAVSGAAATVEVWMHCEVAWKRRGGTNACRCLGFFRVPLRPAVAGPSPLMPSRAASGLRRQACGPVSLPIEGERWRTPTSWKFRRAPLTHTIV